MASKAAREEEFLSQFNVMKCDMPDELKQKAFDVTKEAMDNNTTEKDIATAIKQAFDKVDEGLSTWHCIVGKHFAVSITHAAKYIIFFTVRTHTVLLFKSED